MIVNLCPDFRQMVTGDRTFLVSHSFQLPSTQSSFYAKVACLGMYVLLPFCVLRGFRIPSEEYLIFLVGKSLYQVY
jgi:hypothetical protein